MRNNKQITTRSPKIREIVESPGHQALAYECISFLVRSNQGADDHVFQIDLLDRNPSR